MARDALHGVLALSSKTISLGKLNGAFGAPVAGCSPGLTAGPLPHRHLQEQPAVPRPGSPKKLLRGTVMLLMQSNGTTGLGETKRKKKERGKKKKKEKRAAPESLCFESLYFKQATANIKGEQIHYQQVISKKLITVSLPTRS